MLTAVLTSDNHLGAYYARFRPDRLEERRRTLQRAFTQVVDAALERRADLFLHAGDLYDRPDPRNAERAFVAEQVRRLLDAGVPVCAIAGNHDSPRSYGYDGGTLPHKELEALGAIHLLEGRGKLLKTTIRVRNHTICVWGMSHDPNLAPASCPLERVVAEHSRSGDLDLVLLHHGVEEWTPPFVREKEAVLSRAHLEQLQTDAIGVGHLHAHNATRLHSGAMLMNPGATEHMNFGDEHLECGFYVLHWDGRQVEAEYIRLTPQPMRTLAVKVTERSEQNPEELLPWLMGQIQAISDPRQLLRLRLQGRVRDTHMPHLPLGDLQARGSEQNFHCELETSGLVFYNALADLPLGYGVSFDAGEELQNVAAAVLALYADDPTEQEICRLAAERLAADYSHLTGGAR